MERINAQHSGFTLIETILYVALSGAIAVILIQAIDLIQGIRTRHVVATEVNQQADWAMRRIRWHLRTEELVSPEVGSSSAELEFADGTRVLPVAGRLTEVTETASVFVTGGTVVISSVSFSSIGTDDRQLIRVSFTAAYAAPSSGSRDFQYVRTYETSIARQ